MFKDWRQRRAVKRIKPGDGHALKRYRWWQMLSRALYYFETTDHEGERHSYAVDVDYWTYFFSEAKADLYLDGKHHAHSKLPAAFPVPGGTLQVKMGPVGLKHCHFHSESGVEHPLVPEPSSAEGHRARLEQNRPGLSRLLGVTSLVVLIVAFILGIPQLVEMVTSWDIVAQYTGTWVSPIQIPDWLNGVLIFGAILASVERALRLRYNWLLDGGGDIDLDFS
ncbi:hypothetical protein HGQ17_05485 [Nesterenkonia sp. MY13]|uniref:Uncharacterized protein n=1 Tax=Nesterenkonia sedimenti TaxID=1463632 RepID=A0A7X8TJG4_9MICC|nr:hypothetical protein [Nesterenkonia sedimenti]NLS09467.1 hypothetical protein [Nesterenkonia sedimenti]